MEKIIQGKVPVTWTEEDYKNLDWFTHENIRQKFSADEVSKSFENIDVYTCNSNLPATLLDLADQFQLDTVILAVNKMTPGQVLPFHSDKFLAYKKRNNILENQSITRIIVFLHDPKPGHQLWIDKDFLTGSAGSYFGWKDQTVHMAANLGTEDRYILQITGLDHKEVYL